MLKMITYLSLQFIPTIALSQSTFQLSILEEPTSSSFPAGSITEASNGDIYAVGTTFPGGGFAKNRLVRIDKYGNLLWDTTYAHTSNHEFSPELMPTSDGGVLLTSDSYSYPLADEDTLQDILIWKIDSEGVIEWQQVLSARNFADMNTTKDGGFLLLASIHETAYYQGLDLIAYKLDSVGTLLWSSRLGKQKFDPPWEWEMPNSIREIGSQIYVCGFHTLTGSLKNSGVLYAIDQSGQLVWEILNPYTTIDNDVRISSVFKFNDRYYFNGDGFYEFNPITGNFWEQPDSLNIGFTLKGYNFDVLCGRDKIHVVNFMTDSNYHLRLYDNLLEPYFDAVVTDITGVFAESIVTSDGGNLVLTTAGDVTTQELQITKTDCLGNFGFWSDDCNSKLPNDLTVYAYPNPASSEILIEADFDFEELTIYDVRGAEVKYDNPCSCKFQTIDISHYASGVYQVRVKGTSGIAVARFAKI